MGTKGCRIATNQKGPQWDRILRHTHTQHARLLKMTTNRKIPTETQDNYKETQKDQDEPHLLIQTYHNRRKTHTKREPKQLQRHNMNTNLLQRDNHKVKQKRCLGVFNMTVPRGHLACNPSMRLIVHEEPSSCSQHGRLRSLLPALHGRR